MSDNSPVRVEHYLKCFEVNQRVLIDQIRRAADLLEAEIPVAKQIADEHAEIDKGLIAASLEPLEVLQSVVESANPQLREMQRRVRSIFERQSAAVRLLKEVLNAFAAHPTITFMDDLRVRPNDDE